MNTVLHSERKRSPIPETLREIARDVRRIGCGFRSDPETIAIEKDHVAERLAAVAREFER